MEIRRSLPGWTVIALLYSVGCGGDGKSKKTPASVLETCSQTWSVITLLNDNILTMPTSMVWSDGQLYLASNKAIAVMPAQGGPVTTLVPEAFASTIWLEGDDIIYSSITRLLRVPRAGGVPIPLLELPRSENQYAVSRQGGGHADALDQDAYYWITGSSIGEGLSLWRASRTTAAVERMATPVLGALPVSMAVTPKGILVAGDSVTSTTYEHRVDAFLVPLNGEPPRPFETEEPIYSTVSVDDTGMVWNRYDEGDHTWFSPLDGSARRGLSDDLPDFFVPSWSVPDGQGGRYLAGDELFDNDTTHGSTFHLDAGGNARRLACNPENDWFFIDSWAVAPDAIYFTRGSWDASGAGDGWRIHKIPR